METNACKIAFIKYHESLSETPKSPTKEIFSDNVFSLQHKSYHNERLFMEATELKNHCHSKNMTDQK